VAGNTFKSQGAGRYFFLQIVFVNQSQMPLNYWISQMYAENFMILPAHGHAQIVQHRAVYYRDKAVVKVPDAFGFQTGLYTGLSYKTQHDDRVSQNGAHMNRPVIVVSQADY
jgi:hypothetical protein